MIFKNLTARLVQSDFWELSEPVVYTDSEGNIKGATTVIWFPRTGLASPSVHGLQVQGESRDYYAAVAGNNVYVVPSLTSLLVTWLDKNSIPHFPLWVRHEVNFLASVGYSFYL